MKNKNVKCADLEGIYFKSQGLIFVKVFEQALGVNRPEMRVVSAI